MIPAMLPAEARDNATTLAARRWRFRFFKFWIVLVFLDWMRCFKFRSRFPNLGALLSSFSSEETFKTIVALDLLGAVAATTAESLCSLRFASCSILSCRIAVVGARAGVCSIWKAEIDVTVKRAATVKVSKVLVEYLIIRARHRCRQSFKFLQWLSKLLILYLILYCFMAQRRVLFPFGSSYASEFTNMYYIFFDCRFLVWVVSWCFRITQN